MGKDVIAAIRAGLEDLDRGEAPEKETRPKLTKEERAELGRVRAREDRVRQWRKGEAEKREVPNMVVLPNRGMGWLVRERPDSVDALAEHPDIGRKRAERYGEILLELIRDVA